MRNLCVYDYTFIFWLKNNGYIVVICSLLRVLDPLDAKISFSLEKWFGNDDD